jgi:cation transport ATPase
MSFVISLIYNIIGLSFAVQGTLSPLIAAILMPFKFSNRYRVHHYCYHLIL